jgi:methyltransferase (TIGR00027 family)
MAAVRALISRVGGSSRLLDDPYAPHFLVGRYRHARWIVRAWPSLMRWFADVMHPRAISYIGVRHRAFDDAVAAAVADGVQSVVVLGAGFDCRAFRFAARGVTFYEIDHPLTQRVKRRIVDEQGWLDELQTRVVYAPADLERTPLQEVLADIPRERAIVVWEGVAWYLSEGAVRETLGVLSRWFPPGTEIVFDAIDPDVANGARRDRVASMHRRACEGYGEPIRWGIAPSALGDFLKSCGWTPVDLETPLAAAERLSDPEGKPFTTLGPPLPFFSFVRARVASA